MSNRKCWKSARRWCEEFKVSPAVPSGEPNCTPRLQSSNKDVAAITSLILLKARWFLYSYYIVRMIKFVGS
jgi:hypothetical protein